MLTKRLDGIRFGLDVAVPRNGSWYQVLFDKKSIEPFQLFCRSAGNQMPPHSHAENLPPISVPSIKVLHRRVDRGLPTTKRPDTIGSTGRLARVCSTC